MGTQNQTQQAQQIDKKAILAVILALKEKNSFVLKYGDIEDALGELIEDDNEYDEVRNAFYDLLYDQWIKGVRNLKYIYYIYENERESYFDRVVVSPIELNESQLKILSEVAELLDYGFSRDEYENRNIDEVITKVINGLVRKWSMGCTEDSTPAMAVYKLAKAHNLDVQVVEEHPASVGSGGSVTYSIEDIVKITKWYWYCNDCIVPAGNNFIEKCSTWEFEDNGGQDTTEVSGYG
jgi:hypothetical protein